MSRPHRNRSTCSLQVLDLPRPEPQWQVPIAMAWGMVYSPESLI